MAARKPSRHKCQHRHGRLAGNLQLQNANHYGSTSWRQLVQSGQALKDDPLARQHGGVRGVSVVLTGINPMRNDSRTGNAALYDQKLRNRWAETRDIAGRRAHPR